MRHRSSLHALLACTCRVLAALAAVLVTWALWPRDEDDSDAASVEEAGGEPPRHGPPRQGPLVPDGDASVR